MSPDQFVAVIDAKILSLELQNELPEDFLLALPRQLETVLDTPTFAIGGWEDPTDGPLVLGLDAHGQMISLVSVNPMQADSLNDTLASIDEWLSTMTLRSLSDLSGNSVEFYEGLLELSPNSSITLAPRRRFVLITAMGELDTTTLSARLPDADIEVHYLDVLQGPDGRAIMRGRDAHVEDTVRVGAATPPLDDVNATLEQPRQLNVEAQPRVETVDVVEEAPAVQPVVLAEEFSIAPESDQLVDLTEHEEVIDLSTDMHSPPLAPNFTLPMIEAGGTYSLDQLPLLFDATGASLESISDEMFAVNNAIVIVAALPERRRDTPFEDRRRFRWDTSLDRIQLLNEHGFTASGAQRTVHLFVESERQPTYAAYIGELNRTAFQTQTRVDGETAWFSISPSLQSDLYRLLRKGRLPQFAEGRTVDITTL